MTLSAGLHALRGINTCWRGCHWLPELPLWKVMSWHMGPCTDDAGAAIEMQRDCAACCRGAGCPGCVVPTSLKPARAAARSCVACGTCCPAACTSLSTRVRKGDCQCFVQTRALRVHVQTCTSPGK